jgi:hypothetical protein
MGKLLKWLPIPVSSTRRFASSMPPAPWRVDTITDIRRPKGICISRSKPLPHPHSKKSQHHDLALFLELSVISIPPFFQWRLSSNNFYPTTYWQTDRHSA